MIFPDTDVVPFVAGETTAMLVDTPEICAVRSIGNAIWYVTDTARLATVGGGGKTVMFIAADGAEVPPGLVAVNRKLPVPMKPGVGVNVMTLPTTDVVPFVTLVAAILV